MNKFIIKKIEKSDFIKLNENDLMFITNPGRMGDEDGITFIIKQGVELTAYRISGWMYRTEDKEDISLQDALKQFPKWHVAWNNGNRRRIRGKYKYLYMGFGNGLCVDKTIYKEFVPYLNVLVDKYLEKYNDGEKETFQYAAIYSVWLDAVINMANENGYII